MNVRALCYSTLRVVLGAGSWLHAAVISLVAVGLGLGIQAPTQAGVVTADAATFVRFLAPAAAGGTHDFLAYSERPTAKNAVTNDSFLGAGIPAVTQFGETIEVPEFGFLFVRSYKPPVGFRGRAPKPAGAQSVVSQTPGPGAVTGSASFIFGPPARYRAFGAAILPGDRAAAEVVDPYSVAPGSYSYAPEIANITLETSDLRDFAGVSFWATDSRFSDYLWNAAVVVEGPITATPNLTVLFQSQPLLGLDDAAIAADLEEALAINPGQISLTDYTLFSTTYSVDQEIEFGEGLNAGVEKAPEPSTACMLFIAAIAYAVVSSRHKNYPRFS